MEITSNNRAGVKRVQKGIFTLNSVQTSQQSDENVPSIEANHVKRQKTEGENDRRD